MDIFGADNLPTIIKWVAVILITGFIAQFGKRFADFITDKIKARRGTKGKDKTGRDAISPASESNRDVIYPAKEQLKIEKKKKKVQLKKEKKDKS